MKNRRAFTLVEILIVVVLLGILAATIIPMVANSTMSAKYSALSLDLQMLRRYILIYKAQHLEVAPGYPNGASNQAPTEQVFLDQIMTASKSNGQTAPVGTVGFERGPYLSKMPKNPINGKNSVQVLGNGANFPADGDDSHGWIYKAATSEVRADIPGTDRDGKRYYDY
jgi:general secretion pathway protein G